MVDRRRAGRDLAYMHPERVTRLGEDTYLVRGSKGDDYEVSLEGGSCDCPDHQNRGGRPGFRCRHWWAVQSLSCSPVTYKPKRIRSADGKKEAWTVAITRTGVLLEVMGGAMSREAAEKVSAALNGETEQVTERRSA